MQGQPGYEVSVVRARTEAVAGLRRRITIGPALPVAITELMDELYSALPPEAADAPGYNVVLYLPHDAGRLDVDLVVARHYEPPAPASVERLDLPAGDVAETVHAGDYAELYRAHEATGGWAVANGHALAGPNWEISSTGRMTSLRGGHGSATSWRRDVPNGGTLGSA